MFQDLKSVEGLTSTPMLSGEDSILTHIHPPLFCGIDDGDPSTSPLYRSPVKRPISNPI